MELVKGYWGTNFLPCAGYLGIFRVLTLMAFHPITGAEIFARG